jgi:DNA-binding SARP family transcriptional activator
VLGRIDLAGAGRIERSKSIELIVYLALHPQGVTPDELWEALWPDRPVNRGTLHTTVTAARTGLVAPPMAPAICPMPTTATTGSALRLGWTGPASTP